MPGREKMEKPVLLRTDAALQMGKSMESHFEQLCTNIVAEDDSEETILQLAADADLIFTCYAPITERIIDSAKKLRGIIKYGVGLDSIDLAAAARRGIPVVHCPDYGTEAVADHSFALLIALARRLTDVDRDMRREGWLWPEMGYMASDLHKKTLGLIGLGRIGKAMARRATGFEMRILASDPYIDPAAFSLPGLEYTDFDRVIAEADYLSMHCILTDETRAIINRAVMERMKDNALLVNTARGALIDEEDLLWALRENIIGGAALDVFTDEPLTKEHPLISLANVILTPHFAFYSREAYARLERECYEAARDLLAGKLPRNTVKGDLIQKYGRS